MGTMVFPQDGVPSNRFLLLLRQNELFFGEIEVFERLVGGINRGDQIIPASKNNQSMPVILQIVQHCQINSRKDAGRERIGHSNFFNTPSGPRPNGIWLVLFAQNIPFPVKIVSLESQIMRWNFGFRAQGYFHAAGAVLAPGTINIDEFFAAFSSGYPHGKFRTHRWENGRQHDSGKNEKCFHNRGIKPQNLSKHKPLKSGASRKSAKAEGVAAEPRE
jgi:hypothetical protein